MNSGLFDINDREFELGNVFIQRGGINNPLEVIFEDGAYTARFINGSMFAGRDKFSLKSQCDEHCSAEIIFDSVADYNNVYKGVKK